MEHAASHSPSPHLDLHLRLSFLSVCESSCSQMASSFSMLSPSGRTLIVTFLLVSIIYLTTTALNAANRPISGSFRGSSSGIPASQERTKAIDLRIVGLIFYGRREFVSILHCYLEASTRQRRMSTTDSRKAQPEEKWRSFGRSYLCSQDREEGRFGLA